MHSSTTRNGSNIVDTYSHAVQAQPLRLGFFVLGIKTPPCSPLDGCPRLRFVRAQAGSIVNEFARAATPEARREAQRLAAFVAHWLNQVDGPLFDRLHGKGFAAEVQRLAATLQRLAGCDPAKHEVQFPDDDGRQLVADRLDAIEGLLRAVLHRRDSRHAHDAGQSGETEAA